MPILNLLRAIASLGVCAVHMHYAVNLTNEPINKILTHGQLGVHLFFIISGFVLPYSLWIANYDVNKFFNFLFKRLIRINPPYMVVILIVLLLGYPLDWMKLILHQFYVIPFTNYEWYQGIFWTLGVEFQFYIIIGLAFPFIRNGNINFVIASLILFSMLGHRIHVSHGFAFVFHYFHLFSIGIIVFLYKVKRISLLTANILVFAIAVYLCTSISITNGLIVILSAASIIYLNIEFTITNFIAKISYSLYLTHTIAGEIFQPVLEQFSKNNYINFISLVVFDIIFAYLFYLLIERWAFKWSKSINIAN